MLTCFEQYLLFYIESLLLIRILIVWTGRLLYNELTSNLSPVHIFSTANDSFRLILTLQLTFRIVVIIIIIKLENVLFAVIPNKSRKDSLQ